MLRLRTETPSVLDCARDFIRGVNECVKRVSLCGFHYFTSQKKHGNKIPKDYLPIDKFPTLKHEKAPVISKEDTKKMYEYREKFGKGTLPLNLYQNNIPPKCSPINFVDKQNDNNNEEVQHVQPDQLQPFDEILPKCIYDINDLLAIYINGHLYIGRVAKRVNESSVTCKALLYAETHELNFQIKMKLKIYHLNRCWKLSQHLCTVKQKFIF
ncbi:unnamed protein product [Mytilus edulis]|uniref:Uncharacterized protein n=1 Tax=Mytilus edulis TaxID=6550 RepID=A0A8S3Q761_MYTED|nr:unnamed protein product [Mytilus edulis]